MENQVIKVLNKDHGKKVIQYLKDKGIYTGSYTGSETEADGKEYIYYGIFDNNFGNYSKGFVDYNKLEIIELPDEFVLPEKWCIKKTSENYEIINDYFNKASNTNNYIGKVEYMHYDNYHNYCGFLINKHSCSYIYYGYTEITFEQFKKYVLKETTMEKKKRKLTIQNYRRIYNAACSKWQTKLQDMYSKSFALSDEIIISEDDYKQMRIACTIEQNILFDEIFGKDEEIYPDGTPCLVRVCDGSWNLRYADGNGKFYDGGKKSGISNKWGFHQKLDINNLPVNS